jgi:hypothetical protein
MAKLNQKYNRVLFLLRLKTPLAEIREELKKFPYYEGWPDSEIEFAILRMESLFMKKLPLTRAPKKQERLTVEPKPFSVKQYHPDKVKSLKKKPRRPVGERQIEHELRGVDHIIERPRKSDIENAYEDMDYNRPDGN